MRVCFRVIVRVRINHRCVCVASVVLVRFAPSDPGVRVVTLACVPHPVLGFPTGLFPVGCEGRIHYKTYTLLHLDGTHALLCHEA